MILSKELTPERIKEIMEFPIVYDEDSPKLTKEQLSRMKPKYPGHPQSAKKAEIPRTDATVQQWFAEQLQQG
jgi:hypothetical protein